jgi:hypothetical protein
MAGSDTVCRNIEAWERRQLAAVYALADNYALKSEAMAKRNAPWTDRTGHARQGLFGYVRKPDNRVVVRIAHSMSYGVFLELANSGKYAILGPTARLLAPSFYDNVQRLAKGW